MNMFIGMRIDQLYLAQLEVVVEVHVEEVVAVELPVVEYDFGPQILVLLEEGEEEVVVLV